MANNNILASGEGADYSETLLFGLPFETRTRSNRSFSVRPRNDDDLRRKNERSLGRPLAFYFENSRSFRRSFLY